MSEQGVLRSSAHALTITAVLCRNSPGRRRSRRSNWPIRFRSHSSGDRQKRCGRASRVAAALF
jgi:hypothetical protein